MEPLLPPIDFLIHSTGSWCVYDEHHFEASFIENWEADVLVPDSYLRQAHPLFPEVMRAVIALQEEYRMDIPIAGSLAAASLKLLRGELLCFTDVEGDSAYCSRVTNVFMNDDVVGIVGTYYTVDPVIINGHTQEIVSFQQFGTVDVSKASLDAKFPGWQQRYLIGVELGIEPDELMPTLFNTGISISTPMADVSFA